MLKNPISRRLDVAVASIIVASVTPVLAQLKAFPEAEGHGANATGGRGGTVYHVTNLNNSGAGSFRDAVSVSGRTVVFDVGGWIELVGNSPVAVASNVTIAGQTAPGQGIGIKNSGLSFSNRTNVIIRHLRVRPGPYSDAADRDGVSADSASNSIVDHVSASWGRDEVFSVKNSTNITVQHSIIAEGLFNHSMGGLIEGNTGMSIHHSLYINNNDRNPKTKKELDFVNNVVYNWGAYSYVAGDSAGLSYGNVVGNYFIAGPSSTELNDPISRGNANYSMYLEGNYWDGDQDALHDGNLLTPGEIDDVLTYVPQRFPYAPVYTDTAQRAYEKVLAGAGASLNRDFTDNRLIGLVQTRTGQIISDPAQVGGWGTLTGGAAPTDTDQDGMPDAWEDDFGLNKNDALDRNTLNLFGYTKLEEYINELGGAHIQKVWTAASGDWTTNPLWAGAQPTVDDNVFIRGNGGATTGIATIGSPGAAAWDLRIGGNGAAAGEQLVVNAGGTLSVRNVLSVGYQNRGTLQMNGGTVEAPYVVLGTAGPLAGMSRIGELKLNGGTLRTTLIEPQGPGGTILFGGGAIQASGALSIAAPITLNAGGGTIDTNAFNATITSVIGGTGV
ncbi:MAG: hypothetical protein H7144_00425, partial [Burkholderiales bacterium]|nr:hypothetical protein [Phycisphaerae bacterium]